MFILRAHTYCMPQILEINEYKYPSIKYLRIQHCIITQVLHRFLSYNLHIGSIISYFNKISYFDPHVRPGRLPLVDNLHCFWRVIINPFLSNFCFRYWKTGCMQMQDLVKYIGRRDFESFERCNTNAIVLQCPWMRGGIALLQAWYDVLCPFDL